MEPISPSLPNFFLVGAPKAGTTALYHYLNQHPQIYMSPIKEPCYFAAEVRPENFSPEVQPQVCRDVQQLREYLQGPVSTKRFGGLVTEWDDYLKLFQNVKQETAVGEASVCYLWSQKAPGNISAKVPGARIIMILRNPAERAYSQYSHALSEGRIRMSFRQYIEASQRCPDMRFGSLYPFLEFGLYFRQATQYLQHFPRENVRIYFYDDYRRDPIAILRDVFGFLSVDVSFAPDLSQRHLEPRVPRWVNAAYFLRKHGLWERARNFVPRALRRRLRRVVFRPRESLVLEPADRAYLVDYYREDIQRLSALLDRDLRTWLDCAPRGEREERARCGE